MPLEPSPQLVVTERTTVSLKVIATGLGLILSSAVWMNLQIAEMKEEFPSKELFSVIMGSVGEKIESLTATMETSAMALPEIRQSVSEVEHQHDIFRREFDDHKTHVHEGALSETEIRMLIRDAIEGLENR